jgi:hypothetical protein
MKTEYNIKDTVWIHNGERKLVKGRVVEIIDLEHLEEGHNPNYELYIIEIKTGIDNIYEVRDFGMISPDANGPIAAFRREGLVATNRFLKKIGLPPPQGAEEWQNKSPSTTNNSQPAKNFKKKRYYRNSAKKPVG